ncbi:MAG TPA: type II toxin-antitoxin system VapC family toxin [Acidimicrobiales bacterium]|nr:type II toxin-antitoxin system VapC family toxin [Acidimicrobiales bacterium]
MKLLLDTHVFLWLLTEPERLGDHLELLADPRSELFVSAASSWEIAIKCGLGRLVLPEPPARYVPERIRLLGATAIPVEHAHALAVCSLPPLHRDPFDRILVAQCELLRLQIVTADPAVAQYPVRSLLVGAR